MRVGGDLRVLREKLDETNVRLTSLSQDVDGLREIIPQAGAVGAVPLTPVDPNAPQTPGGADAVSRRDRAGAGGGHAAGHRDDAQAPVRHGLRRLHRRASGRWRCRASRRI